jgi:hypothetical protein
MPGVAVLNRSHQKHRWVYGIPGSANAPSHNHRLGERQAKRESIHMSYSFREPEEHEVCECKYDEIRDRMDRDDCPFHCDLVDDAPEMEVPGPERKRPAVEVIGATVKQPGKAA